MIPLNQSYRIRATQEAYPHIAEARQRFEEWALSTARWCPHDLHPSLGKPGRLHFGRSYDVAMTLTRIDFTGLVVCELGARASFLAPYLTYGAERVHVSDAFGRSHRDLGTLDYWRRLWTRAACRPDRLDVDAVDMRATGFDDATFDVVISYSAIEHIPGTGDTEAAREMARICKPGGLVVIGTDMSDTHRERSAGRHYDATSLYHRLIYPTGCALWGDADFSWEAADRSRHKSGAYEQTSCIFILRKPEVAWARLSRR